MTIRLVKIVSKELRSAVHLFYEYKCIENVYSNILYKL